MARLGKWLWVALAIVTVSIVGVLFYLPSGGMGGARAAAAPIALAPLPRTPLASRVPAEPSATTTPQVVATARPATPKGTVAALTSNAYIVTNTAGAGVALRAAPGTGERIRSWADGTFLVEVGQETRGDGRNWKQVRDPAGNVGWVAADFLASAPASAIALASASPAAPLTVATPTPTGTRPTASPSPTFARLTVSPTSTVTASPTSTSVPTPPIPPTATTPTAPTQTPHDVEALASSGHRQNGYVEVEGRVRNVGGRELRFVWAVVDWYDANGQLVKNHSAPIKQDPFLVGQTSPFKVTAVDNPRIYYYAISFKELRGGTLRMLESSRQ